MKYYFLILVLLIAGCTTQYETITFKNSTVNAEIPTDYEKGLMYRTYMPENDGMLFTFDKDQYLSFWMKNTKISLDIIFISSNFTVVNIQTMEPCADYCISYKSYGKYALEVNKGYANTNRISIGDNVIISKNNS